MTLISLSWALCAVHFGAWAQSAAASEPTVLYLCTSKQDKGTDVETVSLFGNGDESLLKNLFQFQERNGTQKCIEDSPVDLSKIQFTPEGYLSIEKEIESGNKSHPESQKWFLWYAPSEFCIQVSKKRRLEAVRRVKCEKDEQTLDHEESPLMVRKCCPPGFAVDFKIHQEEDYHNYCVASNVRWKPDLYDPESFNGHFCVRPTSKESLPKVRFYTRELETDKFWLTLGPKRPLNNDKGILRFNRARWRLLSNGSFARLYPSTNKRYPYGTWEVAPVACADMLVNIGGIGNPESVEFVVELDEEKETAELTTTEVPETDVTGTTMKAMDISETEAKNNEGLLWNGECKPFKTDTIIYIVCYFLSAPFLLATIFAFVLTRKSQTVYGWTMLSHLVTFLLMNIAAGASMWMSQCIVQGEEVLCTGLGIAVPSLFLSVYVWLTCVNFDLWWTFRELRSRSNDSSLARYYIYAAISIGVSLIFTMTGYILDVVYGEYGYDSDCDLILPEFGLTKCFLADAAEGPYLYYPLLVLLLLNTVFFLLTACKIYRIRASTRFVRRSAESTNTESILMFGKLFIVMGTSCIFEFISWFAQHDLGNNDRSEEEQQNLVFVSIDVINYLGRSIAIFLIFGCKKQVRVEARRVLVQLGVIEEKAGSSPGSSDRTQRSDISASAGGGRIETASGGGALKLKTLKPKGK